MEQEPPHTHHQQDMQRIRCIGTARNTDKRTWLIGACKHVQGYVFSCSCRSLRWLLLKRNFIRYLQKKKEEEDGRTREQAVNNKWERCYYQPAKTRMIRVPTLLCSSCIFCIVGKTWGRNFHLCCHSSCELITAQQLEGYVAFSESGCTNYCISAFLSSAHCRCATTVWNRFLRTQILQSTGTNCTNPSRCCR